MGRSSGLSTPLPQCNQIFWMRYWAWWQADRPRQGLRAADGGLTENAAGMPQRLDGSLSSHRRSWPFRIDGRPISGYIARSRESGPFTRECLAVRADWVDSTRRPPRTLLQGMIEAQRRSGGRQARQMALAALLSSGLLQHAGLPCLAGLKASYKVVRPEGLQRSSFVALMNSVAV